MKQIKHYSFLIVGVLIVLAYNSCSSSKQTVATKPVSPSTQNGNFQKGEVWSPGDMEFSEKFIEALRQEIAGNTQQAVVLLSDCLVIKPNDAATNYELAKIFYGLKKYDAALTYARVPVKKEPDNQWYVQQYADALGANSKFKEAAQVYADYLKRNPNNSDRYFDWAYYLTKAGDYEGAIKAYNQVENMVGINADVSQEKERLYLKMGKVDKAIDEVNNLITSNPGEPSYYAMLADLYSANNMDDKALATLQKLLEIDPNDPQVQLALSNYYTKKGDNEKAFESLKNAFKNPDLDLDTKIKILYPYFNIIQKDSTLRANALELGNIITKTNPASPKSHAIYGDLLNETGDYNGALAEYRKSAGYDSGEFRIFKQIMILDFQMGPARIDSLLKDSKHALALFPDQTYSYYFNGVAKMQKKQYQDAIDVFSKGIKIGSDDKDLLGTMYSDEGDAYHYLKQFHASDSCYDMTLVFDPNDTYVLNNYAYYLSERGENLDKAETMSKKSNELSPNNAAFEDTYAWIYYKEKKYSDAKTWEDKSIKDGGINDAEDLDHYGNILYQLGDIDNAVKYWKMAKDLHLDSAVIDKKISDRKLYE
jgi:tetratricopeptide (TPR) repeat protein